MNDGLFWADFDFSSISGGDNVEFPCTGECVSQFSITWLWNVEVLLDLAFLGFGLGGGPVISTKLSANPFFDSDFTTWKWCGFCQDFALRLNFCEIIQCRNWLGQHFCQWFKNELQIPTHYLGKEENEIILTLWIIIQTL